jgi:glutamine synthetase
MELMRHIAVHHQFSCLLHEKPFKGFNGSGKHSNWSLATDTGLNLLDPSDTPGNNLHFLILLTAILNAVHSHSALLRASIGSYSNDTRLGGHEAPPAIISVFLGQELEAVLEAIEEKGCYKGCHLSKNFDLGSAVIAHIKQDSTDRNRTSPFAFTGNKFEFRAVGAASNPAFPTTVLNAVVADSLNLILDEIEKKGKPLVESAMLVLQKYLNSSKGIRFSGDNYSDSWKKEAKKRKLPNLEKSIEAFEAYKTPSTIRAFKDILTEKELASRYEVVIENYMSNLKIEINLMIEMFTTQILPAALEYQKNSAKSILSTKEMIGAKSPGQIKHLKSLNGLIETAIEKATLLKDAQKKEFKGESGLKALHYLTHVEEKMHELRNSVDTLEQLVDDKLWPIPKYRELLFLI